jgi:glutamyl-tRNA reductase
MKILLKGINHWTAPVELREKLAIESGRLTGATQALLRLIFLFIESVIFPITA